MITTVIHWAAGAEILLLVILIVFARKCNQMIGEKREPDLKKWVVFVLETGNIVFITIVSIFPLLGMWGTVRALISLDMAGNMEGLKNNFFQALDTTEWGIIYAIIFKVVYALLQHYIEEGISKGKELRKKLYR